MSKFNITARPGRRFITDFATVEAEIDRLELELSALTRDKEEAGANLKGGRGSKRNPSRRFASIE